MYYFFLFFFWFFFINFSYANYGNKDTLVRNALLDLDIKFDENNKDPRYMINQLKKIYEKKVRVALDKKVLKDPIIKHQIKKFLQEGQIQEALDIINETSNKKIGVSYIHSLIKKALQKLFLEKNLHYDDYIKIIQNNKK